MLLWLFEHLAGFDSTFQVVRYLSLRALLSVLTSLAIGLALGPYMIQYQDSVPIWRVCLPLSFSFIQQYPFIPPFYL